MVDKRLKGHKLDWDDYAKDGDGRSLKGDDLFKEKEKIYSNDTLPELWGDEYSVMEESDRILHNVIKDRFDIITNLSPEDVAEELGSDFINQKVSGFYLFDLPAYAAHSNPEVSKQLGAMFDMNDAYNISCQVWDRDYFSEDDYIGTVSYDTVDSGGLIPKMEKGNFLFGPYEFGKHTSIFTMAAAQNPNPDCLKEMIKAGADVDNQYNQDALHFAVKYNNSKVVQFLIENGMAVNARSNLFGNKTPVQLALENADPETFEILVKAGAKFSKQDVKKTVPREYNFSFVNGLSPELREQLGFPKEGLLKTKEAALKKSDAASYLAKVSQSQGENKPLQTTKER